MDRLKATIRDIPDFPGPGIVLCDTNPMAKDPCAFVVELDLLGGRDRLAGRRVHALIHY